MKNNEAISEAQAEDVVVFGKPLANQQAIISTDSITEAVREEVLKKQNMALYEWMQRSATEPEKASLKEHEGDKSEEERRKTFAQYLASHPELQAKAFADQTLQSKLQEIEITGFKKVHEEYKSSFKSIDWEEKADGSKSKVIQDNEGRELYTLTEKKQGPITIDGKEIKSYRTINFPGQSEDSTPITNGPLHLSIALKDQDGKNIAADKAQYFSAHYNEAGKLVEVTTPLPVKFMGAGNDAIGYVESEGKIYTLPVTKGKYEAMMQEVAVNHGMGVNLSQVVGAPQQVKGEKIQQKPVLQNTREPELSVIQGEVKASGQLKQAEQPIKVENIETITRVGVVRPELQEAAVVYPSPPAVEPELSVVQGEVKASGQLKQAEQPIKVENIGTISRVGVVRPELQEAAVVYPESPPNKGESQLVQPQPTQQLQSKIEQQSQKAPASSRVSELGRRFRDLIQGKKDQENQPGKEFVDWERKFSTELQASNGDLEKQDKLFTKEFEQALDNRDSKKLQLLVDKHAETLGKEGAKLTDIVFENDGTNPLTKAVRKGNAEAVQILVKAGADRNQKDLNGISAQDLQNQVERLTKKDKPEQQPKRLDSQSAQKSASESDKEFDKKYQEAHARAEKYEKQQEQKKAKKAEEAAREAEKDRWKNLTPAQKKKEMQEKEAKAQEEKRQREQQKQQEIEKQRQEQKQKEYQKQNEERKATEVRAEQERWQKLPPEQQQREKEEQAKKAELDAFRKQLGDELSAVSDRSQSEGIYKKHLKQAMDDKKPEHVEMVLKLGKGAGFSLNSDFEGGTALKYAISSRNSAAAMAIINVVGAQVALEPGLVDLHVEKVKDQQPTDLDIKLSERLTALGAECSPESTAAIEKWGAEKKPPLQQDVKKGQSDLPIADQFREAIATTKLTADERDAIPKTESELQESATNLKTLIAEHKQDLNQYKIGATPLLKYASGQGNVDAVLMLTEAGVKGFDREVLKESLAENLKDAIDSGDLSKVNKQMQNLEKAKKHLGIDLLSEKCLDDKTPLEYAKQGKKPALIIGELQNRELAAVIEPNDEVSAPKKGGVGNLMKKFMTRVTTTSGKEPHPPSHSPSKSKSQDHGIGSR